MSLQPNYVSTLDSKTKNNNNAQLPSAVHSVEPIVRSKLSEKVVQCLFLSLSVRKFFSCLLTENLLHSHGFYQNFIFKLNMVNFSM